MSSSASRSSLGASPSPASRSTAAKASSFAFAERRSERRGRTSRRVLSARREIAALARNEQRSVGQLLSQGAFLIVRVGKLHLPSGQSQRGLECRRLTREPVGS